MKIRKKSMTRNEAVQILKKIGALDPQVAEGYMLTREILRNLDAEQKKSLIELKNQLGESKFNELILRALSGEEQAIKEPGKPKIYIADEYDELEQEQSKAPSQKVRERGGLPIAEPVPEFLDMPYNVSKEREPKKPSVARPALPYSEDTKTVRMSPREQKNFTITRDDVRRMSWIDKFIKERGE